MKKKVFAFLLVALMIVPCLLSACDPAQTAGSRVIFGNVTDLGGDFRFPGFDGSNPAASDLDINNLTVGYSTMELDKSGAYQWNQTVVANHTEEEDDDGNYVITIEIKPGLKFSDGSELKAENYVVYVLACSTEIAVGAKNTGMAGMTYAGYRAFKAYTGPDVKMPTEEEIAKGAVVPSKEFSGVRLYEDNEYKFSLVVDAAAGYYPYYYAETYGSVTPYPVALLLGDDVQIKDDGNGCYLSDEWYAKKSDGTYAKVDHLSSARYDVSTYPFSGPYVIENWDSSTKECTLKLNENFAGNWEGQKPSIDTIVYIKVVSETQMDLLKSGGVDVIGGLTGGNDVNAGLAIVNDGTGTFKESHYNRAGYGKIQFDCDFSPTMFTEVRQAMTYLLDRNDFAQTFTGGYGAVVDGPYSIDSWMWKEVKDTIELDDYAFSVTAAKQLLEEGGWVYNSKGEAYVEGAEGVDSVRYKKLTADEATEYNIGFASVNNTDNIVYKTVKVGDDYYMPLVINWFATVPNEVTDLLVTKLANGAAVKEAGMVIRQTTGDFNQMLAQVNRDSDAGYSDPPVYSMYNLATGFTSPIYDNAFNWSLDPAFFDYSNDKLFDEYDRAFPYYAEDGSHTALSYEQAVEASGGKLGMDYLSMAMVYDVEINDTENYCKWWQAFIERWNELMPEIPLYGNVYYDIYNAKIQNFETTPYFSPAQALVYCTVAE